MSTEADNEMIRVRQILFEALLNANLDAELKRYHSIIVRKKNVGKIIIQLYSMTVTGYERIHFLVVKWNKNEYGGIVKGDERRLDLPGATGIWGKTTDPDLQPTIDTLVKTCTNFTNQSPIFKTKDKEPDEREQLVHNLIARLIVEKCGGKISKLANDDGDVVRMSHPWVSRIILSSEWIRISWARLTGYFSHADIEYNKFTIDPEHVAGEINATLHKVNNSMTHIDAAFRELGQCTTTKKLD